MKFIKTRTVFLLESSAVASAEDLAIIKPYYVVAKKALEQKKISEIESSEDNDDIFFIIKNSNGKLDKIQLDSNKKDVSIIRDYEKVTGYCDDGYPMNKKGNIIEFDKKTIIKKAEPSDLAEMLGMKVTESIDEDEEKCVTDVYELKDGEDTWYLTYIDSTHFFLSNSKDFKGNAYHIGQFKTKPYYDVVLNWLHSCIKSKNEIADKTVDEARATGEKRDYKEFIERKKKEYLSKFDDSDLDPRFIPFYENGERIKIESDGRQITGTVGVTTGWKPVFLLMRTSRSLGSSEILNKDTKII